MVTTREILYVLLITLAAGGIYDPETGAGAYSGCGAILPLLLLLLFSTNNPCCGDPCCNPCCGRLGTTAGGVFGRVF